VLKYSELYLVTCLLKAALCLPNPNLGLALERLGMNAVHQARIKVDKDLAIRKLAPEWQGRCRTRGGKGNEVLPLMLLQPEPEVTPAAI